MSYDNPPKEPKEPCDLTDAETVDAIRDDMDLSIQFLLYKLNESISNIKSAIAEIDEMKRLGYPIPYTDVNNCITAINETIANLSKKELE